MTSNQNTCSLVRLDGFAVILTALASLSKAFGSLQCIEDKLAILIHSL